MNSISPVPPPEEALNTGSAPVVQLSFAAAAGQSYVIQRSHNRLEWVNVMTVPAGMTRLVEIATSRGRGGRFYRAVPAVGRATSFSPVNAVECEQEPVSAVDAR